MRTRARQDQHPFAAGWFDAWLRLFVVGVIGGIVAVALAPFAQMQTIGAITIGCALTGALLCAMGVRMYNPARWRELAGHVTSLGESLRGATEAIGEPRHPAYARAVPPFDAPHPRV